MVETGRIPGEILAQVELRQKEAIDKDFFGKVRTICGIIGYRETGSGYVPESSVGGDFSYNYIKRFVSSMGLGLEFSERTYDDKSGVRTARIHKSGIFTSSPVLEIECEVKPGEQDVLDVKMYIPGDWERKFDDLFTKANEVAAIRKQDEIDLANAEKRATINDLRNRFGL